MLASDRDSGVNGEITYRILSGNSNGHFTINESSGLLQLSVSPDYEMVG